MCQNYHHLYDGRTRFKSGSLRIKGGQSTSDIFLPVLRGVDFVTVLTTVLPPIPTTGLTTADVPSLIERTRNAMLKTLHELDDPFQPALPSPGDSDTSLDSTDALFHPRGPSSQVRRSTDNENASYGTNTGTSEVPAKDANAKSASASIVEVAETDSVGTDGGGDGDGDTDLDAEDVDAGLGEAGTGPGTGVAPEVETSSNPPGEPTGGRQTRSSARSSASAKGAGGKKKLAIA